MQVAFTDGRVVIREKKNLIFFTSTDSFVALQSFSFLKAFGSEDREEDEDKEGGWWQKVLLLEQI